MIYLIHNRETDRVKIGVSKDPLARLQQLKTGNDCKLSLLRCYDLADSAEKLIHHLLRLNRCRGEWFELKPLDSYLAFLDDWVKCLELREFP